MRLRRNQLCPLHRSLFCCGREAKPRERRQRQMGGSPHRGPTPSPGIPGNPLKRRDAEAPSTGRSSPRRASAPSVWRGSPSTPTSCPTTFTPAVWAEPGGTITRTTSKPSTGGATARRDRAEGDFRPERYFLLSFFLKQMQTVSLPCVRDYRINITTCVIFKT